MRKLELLGSLGLNLQVPGSEEAARTESGAHSGEITRLSFPSFPSVSRGENWVTVTNIEWTYPKKSKQRKHQKAA